MEYIQGQLMATRTFPSEQKIGILGVYEPAFWLIEMPEVCGHKSTSRKQTNESKQS